MGELIVTFGEDGKAHMYDSDFDVTIHCEDEQQMNEAVELLHLANRMHWRKTAEEPPTEADANDCEMVLAVATGYIGTRYHKNVETWPFDTVALLPKEFPIWMPLPKLPGERPKKLYWREKACTTICPVCGYECNDDYYLDKFCPGCGTRLWFNREEAEHDQPDM